MPSTVYASSNDGIALQGLNSWADCRGGGGNGTDTGVNRDNAAVQVIGSARGGGTYGIRRAFLILTRQVLPVQLLLLFLF